MNTELVSKTVPNKTYFNNVLCNLVEDEIITLDEKVKSLDNLNAEQLIIYIARVSSSRDNKLEDYEELLNYLINNAHWSPFEHAYMTIEIETSRAIGRQLIRHRSFTFQEFSQRYSKALNFEDIELREQPENNRQSSGELVDPYILGHHHGEVSSIIKDHLEIDVMCLYETLLEKGVARECARMILPECTTTTIYMTGNIRSWLAFLNIRLDHHAQKEIRIVAEEIANILKNEFPIITEATKTFNNYSGNFM